MKKIIISLTMALIALSAGAQQFYQDAKNSEMVHPSEHRNVHRKVICIPQVNGYNVYKADLHAHSVYSDGHVLPKYRVQEAWQDGLDVLAMTDHIEYRPIEADMVTHLQKYTDKKHKETVNNRIPNNGVITKEGIMADLNTSVRLARKAAKGYGITIIPGVEITRDAGTVGHMNALFTTDNNLIFDPDPYQSVLNAKAQGALVMHNHPGWRRTEVGYSEWQKKVYSEGLIDGVEVMNGDEIYPSITDRCVENNLFISANTDIHATTASEYRTYGEDRPMTLIFAKDKSLEALREALDARRTLAYGFGNVCGPDQLLKDLFLACVKVEQVTGSKYQLTNMSSIPYVVEVPGKNRVHLDPFTSVFFSVAKDSNVLQLNVLSMWNGTNTHPTVEISVK